MRILGCCLEPAEEESETEMLDTVQNPTQNLAAFAAGLRFKDIPTPVVDRCVDLFVDWFGSALAGKGVGPVESIRAFAREMGPSGGDSEIIIDRSMSSPVFAAMVNAASSHVAEQDDVHNGSVFHPAAVVFPPVLAVAQSTRASGREMIAAAVAGYEVGIRVGEFLGRSHYRIFHTTGTAGTIAAAAATGRLLNLSEEQMVHAFGSAGTQAAGLWEFLRDAADSKPLHTAKAAANGLIAAWLARDGFTGAQNILEGAQGLGAAMSSDADPSRLDDGLGSRWALSETSFKFHASCRHTHPAADALLLAMEKNGLKFDEIESVTARVHQGAIDVLGTVTEPSTVHQAKFSMGTTLGLIVAHRRAGMDEFDKHALEPDIAQFRERVRMVFDDEVDSAYPAKWIGKIAVRTHDGREFQARVDEPKGDPGNTLSRTEIENKVGGLAAFSNSASTGEVEALLPRLWKITETNSVGSLLS